MRVMWRQAPSHAIDRWSHSFPQVLSAEPGDPNITIPMNEPFEEER